MSRIRTQLRMSEDGGVKRAREELARRDQTRPSDPNAPERPRRDATEEQERAVRAERERRES